MTTQGRGSATGYITALAATIVIGGALIVVYAWATPGSHVRYGSTGLLVATASLTTGAFVGFLLGIPRIVSSGAHRLKGMMKDVEAPRPGSQFAPSTNLAEISDWLTKLLLGAGLVGLTQIGPPLGALIDSVARGLYDSASISDVGSAEVVAGAIICTYLTVGILGGYTVTTIKYRKSPRPARRLRSRPRDRYPRRMPVHVCARLLPTALTAVVVFVSAGCGSETDDDASTIVRTTTAIAGAGVVGYDRDTRDACPAPVPADPADGDTREMTHVAGMSTVPADPLRIVVLSTQALDTACALGLWERVVGAVTVDGESPQPRYLGTGIAQIPGIGPVRAPDPALIEQAHPDLILGSAPVDSVSWQQLESIAPTVFTGAPNDWRRQFRDQATALGRGSAATPALDDYQTLARDTGISLTSPQTEASVVRFTDDTITVLGTDSFAGQVLADTGARRPGAQRGGSFELSTDHIATADGDLIYVTLAGPGGIEHGTDVLESDEWHDLGAATDRRVFAVDDPVWSGYGLVAARALVADVGFSLNGYVS